MPGDWYLLLPGWHGLVRVLIEGCRRVEARLLPRVEKALIAALAIAILAVVTLHVVARLIGQSFPWTEEAARLGTIWAVFLSVPVFVRQERLLALRIGIDALPPRIRQIVTCFNSLLLMIVMVAILRIALPVVVRDWGRETPGLNWPVGLFSLPIVIMAILSLVHALPIAVRHTRSAISGRIDATRQRVIDETAI